jgi:replicative DNA helicase
LPHLKLTTQREWRCPCPIHSGKRDSFAINSETGLAQCHSTCGRGWDMIALEQELSGLDFLRAKERVFELVGRPKVPWEERNVESIYDYTDAKGHLLYQVLRYHGKEFKQRRPAEGGGWIWGLGDVPRVPFHLPRIVNAEFIGLAEGEKDALTLDRIGITGSCNSGGAGNFKPELAQYFAGKHVAIFPDNDDAGREHALKVAALLSPLAKSLKIVELPDLPPKGDVTDYANAGGTVDAIRELYRNAQPWTAEWEFSSTVPDENDRWVHTIESDVKAAGGLEQFWDLGKLSGLRTPWQKLSRVLGGGLRPGEVYVLGANQGAGKTSLAIQFGLAAMRRKEGVLYFSMEMRSVDVFQRMAGIETQVDLNELREAQYTLKRRDSDPEQIFQARNVLKEILMPLGHRISELAQFPLLVSNKPSVTPEYIVSESTRLKRRNQIHLVIVDHMQLMAEEKGAHGDYEKFTAISRAMKQVAVELAVPVLLVSQTSRAQSREKRPEVEVSDLRGSGAIEEDAAAVMLLFEDATDKLEALRDGDGTRYTKGPVKCSLKVAKNRYGQQGRCFTLEHYKSFARFEMSGEALEHP